MVQTRSSGAKAGLNGVKTRSSRAKVGGDGAKAGLGGVKTRSSRAKSGENGLKVRFIPECLVVDAKRAKVAKVAKVAEVAKPAKVDKGVNTAGIDFLSEGYFLRESLDSLDSNRSAADLSGGRGDQNRELLRGTLHSQFVAMLPEEPLNSPDSKGLGFYQPGQEVDKDRKLRLSTLQGQFNDCYVNYSRIERLVAEQHGVVGDDYEGMLLEQMYAEALFEQRGYKTTGRSIVFAECEIKIWKRSVNCLATMREVTDARRVGDMDVDPAQVVSADLLAYILVPLGKGEENIAYVDFLHLNTLVHLLTMVSQLGVARTLFPGLHDDRLRLSLGDMKKVLEFIGGKYSRELYSGLMGLKEEEELTQLISEINSALKTYDHYFSAVDGAEKLPSSHKSHVSVEEQVRICDKLT